MANTSISIGARSETGGGGMVYMKSVTDFAPVQLTLHLESQFKEGMTWENYGDWHIDHITPLVNAKRPEDVIKLNRLKNLQPLWAEENLSKNRF